MPKIRGEAGIRECRKRFCNLSLSQLVRNVDDSTEVDMGQGKKMDGQDSVAEKGVLHRLLQARDQSSSKSGHAPQLPITPTLTPAKAGAVAIARAANDLFDLPMKAEEVALGGVTLAELPEVLPESALLAVLQGPKDAIGVMAISLEAVIALIEIQTVNQVTSRPLQRRKATRADALMCAEFINKLLKELGDELGALEGFEGIGKFRYASNLDEPRPLQLILSDVPHRCITFQIKIGRDKLREATIFLALPQAAISKLPLPDPADKGEEEFSVKTHPKNEPPAKNAPTLAAAVQDCLVEVVGILSRRQITLGELRGLQPGKVLTLPRANLNKTRIELCTGELLAMGKLGEAAGCHAIRIADPDALEDSLPTTMSGISARQAIDTDLSMELAISNEMPMDLSSPDDFLNPAENNQGGGQIMPDFDLPANLGNV